MKKGILLLVTLCMLLCGCSNTKENDNKLSDESKNNQTVTNTSNSGELTNTFLESESGENKLQEISGDEIDIEVIQTSNSNLANKKCAWGFRRMKDNVQPEFSSDYVKPLNDYEGIYVGSKEEKRIYLTFDEGYENGYTKEILDTLKEKEVTAVFFVTMPYVKQNPDLVKRMIEEGHIVGNHTVNHPSMPEVTDDEKLKKEITELHDYIKENFNYEMTYLRPPKGEYSERTVKISKDLGYTTVLWSSAYDDWDVNKQGRLDYARKMIYNNLHNGSVMLLHAVSKDNTELLPEIIDEIRNKGYEFYSLDEFIYN